MNTKEPIITTNELEEVVAVENTDEGGGKISIPFDPNTVKVTILQSTLETIIDRLENNEIKLLTDFQRKAGLWDAKTKCRLIESLLLRMPIPAFYFDGQDENQWQVVDGLQRTSAIKEFIVDKTLKLDDLEFLHQYNGLGFESLPRELQRRIRAFPITINILDKGTPDFVKFNLFKRINTSGLPLSPQEIRHALNQGIPSNFVKKLAELEEFKKATCNAIKSERMEDRDFVTRFVSFYLIPYTEYGSTDLDTFLNSGMAKLKLISLSDRENCVKNFIKSMNAAHSIFENDAFRKRFNRKDARKPINKALFETFSVSLAVTSKIQIETLIEKKEILIDFYINELSANKQFERSITYGTGGKATVFIRFETIKNIIEKTLSTVS